jgi:RNA polymerase sigma-70 factor (ECF subfamily)
LVESRFREGGSGIIFAKGLFMNGSSETLDLDTHLMLRVRHGDTHCFTFLLERHRAPVVRFLNRVVQNQAIAEELAQEVFLRVYRARATYEPSAKFTTWLYRIATHLALNWLRGQKFEKNGESLDLADDGIFRQVPDREPTVEEKLLREARFEEIRGAIHSLPGKQRAAVVMHKYQELEYSEIASVLGCTDSAVKSLLFRAYESLRSQLAHMAA